MKQKPKRRSTRMQGFNYSSNGLYFITICTQNKKPLFGKMINDKIILNDAGKMIEKVWQEIPEHYPEFNILEHVIMPNHFHGIIEKAISPAIINESQNIPLKPSGQPQGVAPTMSLSDIIHRFKTFTTKLYTDGVKNKNWSRFEKKLWQRNYFEHVIRNENSYHKIAIYIEGNPALWRSDKYFT